MDNSPVIAVSDLSVRLGENPVLHEVTASVSRGEMVALLGGNGAGKTTLLRSILGLAPHDSGSVELFGTPIEQFRDWAKLGYVPQRSQLQVSKATIEELVTSGRLAKRRWFTPLRRDDKKAIDDALEMVKLAPLRNREMTQLSGGQRQRAVIARALAGRPKLILLDEPMAGLDIPTQEGLASIFATMKAEGLTVLVVLHDLGPLEDLLDRSIVLQAGRKIYDGPLNSGSGTSHLDENAPARLPGLQPLGESA